MQVAVAALITRAVLMSEWNEQSPSVQAAVSLERRLTRIEGQLERMSEQTDQTNTTLQQLVERVGTQNGRISKTEEATRDVRKQVTDYEELIAKPRWASLETVKTKVETLWIAYSARGVIEEQQERVWTAIKRRADIIAIGITVVASMRAEDIMALFM